MWPISLGASLSSVAATTFRACDAPHEHFERQRPSAAPIGSCCNGIARIRILRFMMLSCSSHLIVRVSGSHALSDHTWLVFDIFTVNSQMRSALWKIRFGVYLALLSSLKRETQPFLWELQKPRGIVVEKVPDGVLDDMSVQSLFDKATSAKHMMR